MNSQQLKQKTIHQFAEHEIPANYSPWEVIKLRAEKNLPKRSSVRLVKPANKGILTRSLGYVMLLALLAGAIYLITPQGQVTANSLWRFFQKAESNTLPLPEINPVPAQIEGENNQQGSWTRGLTLSEAEELAKFKVQELKYAPEGYIRTDMIFNSQTQSVLQIFKFHPAQAGEMFILDQQLSSNGEPVGQNAEIEQISIGNTLVEVVNGAWFTADSSKLQEWTSESQIRTYRWQQDGFFFTLQFSVGDTFSPAYLSKEDMQAVVETAVGVRTTPLVKANLNNLSNIEEVKHAAPFQLLAPALVPEGFILERGVYEPENKRVVLIYRPQDSSGSLNNASLVIFEILNDGSSPSPYYAKEWPTGMIKQVMVGSAAGTLTHGTVDKGGYFPSPDYSLYWETDTLRITINFSASSSDPSRLDEAGLIQIAESLR